MAPKKNKQREKQEQSKASSSARAQESLLRSFAGHGGASGGFIGFSAFASDGSAASTMAVTSSTSNATESVLYDGSDHEIATALKMLGKKGTVTKVKALQSFVRDIIPPKKPIEIRPWLGHFLYLYVNEVRDQNDHRVRVLVNEVLQALAQKLKPKAFAAHLRRLLPFWLLAQHDIYADVAQVARMAFDSLIEMPDMRLKLLEEHLDVMLEEFQAFFTRSPAQFDGITLSPDEQEERYERCVTTALRAVRTLIVSFAQADRVDAILAQEGSEHSISAFVASPTMTRLVSMTSKNANFPRDSVRRASYEVITAYVTHVAEQIDSVQAEHLGNVAFGALNEKSGANHEAMWDMILSHGQRFGHIWSAESAFRKFAQSAVWPRLYAQIRHGFHGSVKVSLPALLPLLSLVPMEAVVQSSSGQADVYRSVLMELNKLVVSTEAKGEEQLVVSTFIECLSACFLLLPAKPTNSKWLGGIGADQFPVQNYVMQFEKPMKDLLCTLLSFRTFQYDSVAMTCLQQVLAAVARIRSGPKNADHLVCPFGAIFSECFYSWCADAILQLVAKAQCSSVRLAQVLVFLQQQHQEEAMVVTPTWVVAMKSVYAETLTSLSKIEDCVHDVNNVNGMLDLARTLFNQMGVAQVIGEDDVDYHYQHFYRPVIQSLASAFRDDMPKLLPALSCFGELLVAAKEKKSMLLELIQDFQVKYGDLKYAANIISSCLQFDFPEEAQRCWLQSGSLNTAGDEPLDPMASDSIETLDAVWKGKLLDEFLVLSLRGRLDEVDKDAFRDLADAVLGCKLFAPVVSLDAVLILGHLIIKTESDTQLLLAVAPSLLSLFERITLSETTSELDKMQHEMLLRLFHCQSCEDRGIAEKAIELWENHGKKLLLRRSESDYELFVTELANSINSLTSDTKCLDTTALTRLIGLMKHFLLLTEAEEHEMRSKVCVISKLNMLHLRRETDVEDATCVFYDHLISCLGDITSDERALRVLTLYLTTQFENGNAEVVVQLLAKLLDIDVCHSLTWLVLQAHWRVSPLRTSVDNRVSIVSNYLALDTLFCALTSASPSLLSAVLQYLIQVLQQKSTMEQKYRTVMFINQNRDQGIPDRLDAAMNYELNELLVSILSSFMAGAELGRLLQQASETGSLWSPPPCHRSVYEAPWTLFLREEFQDPYLKDIQEALVNHLMQYLDGQLSMQKKTLSNYVTSLPLVTATWQRDTERVSKYTEILLRVLESLSTTLMINSDTSVSAHDWTTICHFVSAFPASLLCEDSIRDAWQQVCVSLLHHAIRAKKDSSSVAGMSLHRRHACSLSDDMADEAFVLSYPRTLVEARTGVLLVLGALYQHDCHDRLHEMANHMREALLSVALCAQADAIELKARVVSTYVSLMSSSKSLCVIFTSFAVHRIIAALFEVLPNVLHSLVHDSTVIRQLLLDAVGGIDALVRFFDAQQYHLSTSTRLLLYILISSCDAFQTTLSRDNLAVDLTGDDEDATESAVATAILPTSVRQVMNVTFANPADGTTHPASRRLPSTDEEESNAINKLVLWDLFLQVFPADSSTQGGTMVTSALGSYASKSGALSSYLSFCASLLASDRTYRDSSTSKLVLQDELLFHMKEWADHEPMDSLTRQEVMRMAARGFFRTVVRLPAHVRRWYTDECSRTLRTWATKYFEDHITPYLLSKELEIIQQAGVTHGAALGDMSVRGSRVSREITATYVQDDCTLEMVLRVPSCYPLRSVEVECTKRIGITEDRWRRWVLQIIKMTASQDGSLLDAVLLWKQNIDKEFEGVEPCPICYSILNPKNMGLPNLTCKTCANKYHNSCLYKWFNQSGKNKCPLCQQPFC